jgi:Domain of unknown function (DUF222)/HNH endonuclease
MPATRAAWRAGEVSPAHVRELARLAGHPRAGAHFADGEDLLVGEAPRARFDGWSQLCAHWRDAADPDGPEQRRGRDQDLRRFTLAPGLDGVTHPDGYLTAIGSATVGGALGRIERELFDADWAAAKAVHGDATTTAHLVRTPAQRRHDALVVMAERAMAAPADGKRPAPLVTVLVDYPTLAGRVCELAGSGTVLPPGDVLELLARDDTLLERAVFHGANKIVDISSARTFRGTVRRVLDLVHRRCGHPTCFVPAEDCQGDHVVPWSQGGPTSTDNGRPACGHHNRWNYTHGRTTSDPPGEPTSRRASDPLPAEPSRSPTTARPTTGPLPPGPTSGSPPATTPRHAHWVLRVPRPRTPDLRHPTDRCCIDLSPGSGGPEWRDYPSRRPAIAA